MLMVAASRFAISELWSIPSRYLCIHSPGEVNAACYLKSQVSQHKMMGPNRDRVLSHVTREWCCRSLMAPD